MFHLSRAYKKQNKICFAFQRVCHLILCKPGTVFSSTEAKAQNVENYSKIESKTTKKKHLSGNVGKTDFQAFSMYKQDSEKVVGKKNMIQLSESIMGVNDYIKFIESGPPRNALQVFSYLTRKGYKAPDICKAIFSKLWNAPSEFFTLKNCSNILYCCACLSFKEENLIEKVVSEIHKKSLNAESRKYSPFIVRSLGSLKYKDCEVMDALIKNILEYPLPKRLKDLKTSLITLSVINSKTPYTIVMLKELNSLDSSQFFGTKEYLDFVWASVLLNEMDENHISKVLSKEYVEALRIFGGVHGANEIINLKLQNINAAAKNLMPGYQGPFLESTFSRPQSPAAKIRFLNEAIDGLCHIFPKNGFLKTCKDINVGFLIDVEFLLDNKKEPVALLKSQGNKIALMLLDFNDFCLGKEKTMTGINAFKQRILESLGYHVLTVSYKEYHSDLTVAEKISFFNNKIQQIKLNFK